MPEELAVYVRKYATLLPPHKHHPHLQVPLQLSSQWSAENILRKSSSITKESVHPSELSAGEGLKLFRLDFHCTAEKGLVYCGIDKFTYAYHKLGCKHTPQSHL